MSRSSSCHLACAVVGDYLPHAAAMLASVIEHGGEPDLTVHLLHDGGLPLSDLALLRSWLEQEGVALELHEIPDERVAGLPTAGFTGKGSWYRIFLPELLPEVDRLLYLDADLLVLAPIVPLREVDLSSAYLAAVTNVFEPRHAHRPAELGLAGPEQYFNAGVLLMNLATMRRDRCGARLLEYGIAHAPELVWRDQDALNVVLGAGRVQLHPRWNCMHSVMTFPHAVAVFGADATAEARRSPAIRHFEGQLFNKPWHYLAEPDLQALYRHHRQVTPWPEVVLEDRTPVTAVLRRLPRPLMAQAYFRLLRLRARLPGELRLSGARDR